MMTGLADCGPRPAVFYITRAICQSPHVWRAVTCALRPCVLGNIVSGVLAPVLAMLHDFPMTSHSQGSFVR